MHAQPVFGSWARAWRSALPRLMRACASGWRHSGGLSWSEIAQPPARNSAAWLMIRRPNPGANPAVNVASDLRATARHDLAGLVRRRVDL
jgi:hypothetical protein